MTVLLFAVAFVLALLAIPIGSPLLSALLILCALLLFAVGWDRLTDPRRRSERHAARRGGYLR